MTDIDLTRIALNFERKKENNKRWIKENKEYRKKYLKTYRKKTRQKKYCRVCDKILYSHAISFHLQSWKHILRKMIYYLQNKDKKNFLRVIEKIKSKLK